MTAHEHQWVEEQYGYVCMICGLVDPCFDDEREYQTDPYDEDNEDWFDCGWVRGVGCTKAGSEECDWECPHRAAFEKGMRLTQARLAKRKK